MIDHISVAVSDLERAAHFYEMTLAPLGLSRWVTRPKTVGFPHDRVRYYATFVVDPDGNRIEAVTFPAD